ncbi:MobA/MobL family protein [Muricomes sp. OA1]|jgi:hypothetical protein|uniref:Mobilization protein n=1 Tax=Hungatella hathewayi TaxID=154046 RepID=A0A3E2WV04_9FIRM|nr:MULTISPECIES: MobQ family relaxase [Clostridia]MCH1972180.1 MobA/MobL family protein [Muricomes sp. OA1]RGC31239.1 mobilization protein [Hungatella hathewayi]GKH30999.1 hypothetical protein CE91St64_04060 [Faecalicatena contorta]
MAIYHLEAKVVSRGAGRSAVAASAYLSCSRLYNDYDGIQHDYTKKQGLVWHQIFLPEYALQEWQNREKLWNAVEEVETAKDSRLAREFVVALPIELNREQQIELLQAFIQEQFVSDGMCADAAIHDTDGHNPHAHILLTVRPLDEQGKWQYKTEKEYLCMRNGEEQGFTATEFRTAQNEGWEKQYPYKIGKKKVYMTPSAAEAQGLVRADKHPKSTRYGRQNPISERWNSEEQLVVWRAAWADVTNRQLEMYGHDERIDHRSNAARGLDEQPTIHEGVTARALERKGIIADRCEINRQIKADNALLRELKAAVKKLGQAVKNTLPAIAEAMENLRKNLLLFCYQLGYLRKGKERLNTSLNTLRPALTQYNQLAKDIRDKAKERRSLLSEKKALSAVHVFRHRELAAKIAALTEDLEELRSEKNLLLASLAYTEDDVADKFPKDIATMKQSLKRLEEQGQKYSTELDAALNEYAGLREQAQGFNPVQLYETRQAIRPGKEQEAENRAQQVYGEKYNLLLMFDSKKAVSRMLDEDAERQNVRRLVRLAHKEQQTFQKEKSAQER